MTRRWQSPFSISSCTDDDIAVEENLKNQIYRLAALDAEGQCAGLESNRCWRQFALRGTTSLKQSERNAPSF